MFGKLFGKYLVGSVAHQPHSVYWFLCSANNLASQPPTFFPFSATNAVAGSLLKYHGQTNNQSLNGVAKLSKKAWAKIELVVVLIEFFIYNNNLATAASKVVWDPGLLYTGDQMVTGA